MGNSPSYSVERYDVYNNQSCEGDDYHKMIDSNCGKGLVGDNYPISAYECAKLCSNDEACQAFTYGGDCPKWGVSLYEGTSFRKTDAKQCIRFHGGRFPVRGDRLLNCELKHSQGKTTYMKNAGVRFHRKNDKVKGFDNTGRNSQRGTVAVKNPKLLLP